MAKGDKISEGDTLTASQEQMPPPGIALGTRPTTRSQTSDKDDVPKVGDRSSQYKATITSNEVKGKNAQDKKAQEAVDKQKKIDDMRNAVLKLSPKKGTSLTARGTPRSCRLSI